MMMPGWSAHYVYLTLLLVAKLIHLINRAFEKNRRQIYTPPPPPPFLYPPTTPNSASSPDDVREHHRETINFLRRQCRMDIIEVARIIATTRGHINYVSCVTVSNERHR